MVDSATTILEEITDIKTETMAAMNAFQNHEVANKITTSRTRRMWMLQTTWPTATKYRG